MEVVDVIELAKFKGASRIRIFTHNGKYDGWEFEFPDSDSNECK